MSDDNEHTSEEAEAEMNAGNNQTSEQSKSDTSMLNNGTEQPMLEDEEMPTYISVSSPSKRDDSDVNGSKQQEIGPMEEDHSRSPYPSDDQGGGSIYVLSSGEESNRYDEEDDDEYADSEDMDEMDLEKEHDNIMLEDEEDEDDEDDEDENPLRLPQDDDDDMDTEYEQEQYERASDDCVLNKRLKQQHKERSLSLQDLSFSKNNFHPLYNKKRHSINVFRHNYVDMQQNAIVYPVRQRRSGQFKYQHVGSKVKQYIRDIKEQNRKSIERRIKEQEFLMNTIHRDIEHDAELLKLSVPRTIKDYAEKAFKDLQRQENDDEVHSVYPATEIIENGETNKINIKVTENQQKNFQKDPETDPFAETQSEKHMQNYDDRLDKLNGSVDINAHHTKYQNPLDSNARLNNLEQASLVNGHQQTPTLLNLRTLSYEEYMCGTTANQQVELVKQKRSSQEKDNKPEAYNEVEMSTQEIENSNTSCPLKIESVESIRIVQEEPENANFVKLNVVDKMSAESIEIAQLKNQLEQKDAQFNTLRNAYQKTLAENIKMKQELDALKKSLAQQENENKARETKVASMQTDAIVEPVTNQKSTISSGETNNKASTSSVASTISSIDHWADSACSPAVSIKPPDVTSILNSDDSIVLTDGTPRRIAHPLSRTFVTSSRILQTLSNITQGKTKVESPLMQNFKKRLNENSTDQLLNLEHNSPIQASSSKKRKATDMLGTSAFAQPFKIPHTAVESEEKNRNDTTEADFKLSGETSNLKSNQQQNASFKSVDGSAAIEVKTEGANDQEDSVKCFIYREHENSQNKSFLIQAEEATKDLDNDKNRIQECGPYLLGNLEVRMSEINGTISVWGKEISDECTSDNEDDTEGSVKSVDRSSTCPCWQKTRQTRFNGSSLTCSTIKKPKIPLRLSRSNVSHCSHSSSSNAIKSPNLIDDVNDRKHTDNSFNSTCVSSCENCGSTQHRKEWSICRGASSSREKSHSCCVHPAEVVDKECNCVSYHEKQKYNDSPNISRDKFHGKGIRRNSYKNTLTSETNKHLYENFTNSTSEMNEVICKYNQSRRSLPNIENSSSTHSAKCAINTRNAPYTCKSCLDNNHSHDHSDRQTCRHSPSIDGDEVPLLSHKRDETPETRQRRLSGKKVRGILMDFLRGCGDCRSNTNGVSKTDLQQKSTLSTPNRPPRIKITSPTPEPTTSNSTQCNERCHTYARRIESQLEEFRMEMERVRSRSDAILDMLNMLHSVDMN